MMPFRLNVGRWIEGVIGWMQDVLGPTFDWLSDVLLGLVRGFDGVLQSVPPWIVLAVGILAGWRLRGWRLAALVAGGLLAIDGLRLWDEAMSTLALVLSASAISLVIGIPVGIAAARLDWVDRTLRPILDFMQTMPAFVYLIPAITLFGLGEVPGIMATVIFAMPPAIRLTNLGIRQVPADVVEAADSFGSTPWQLLREVQFPLALPTIMAGVNQTIMLALSMVVIAAMIGAGGLGEVVIKGITQLEVGLGFEGGLGVVILAILLDRTTEALGRRQRAASR